MTSDLNSIVLEIKSEADRLYKLKNGEQDIFEALSSLDKKHLIQTSRKYKGSENRPVNHLRYEIIELLLRGEKVNPKVIEELQANIIVNAKGESFRSWGFFSILYPIFMREFPFDIKSTLVENALEIIDFCDLKGVAAQPHAVDFNGPRNFGSDYVWVAIYNKGHENQEKAVQFLLRVDKDGLTCHVYDRFNDKYLETLQVSESEDVRMQVLEFYEKKGHYIVEDDPNKKTETFREIGVKDRNFYKISHGADFFTKEEVQYCLYQNIVVVHEDTPAKGQKNDTQFDTFQSARAGDLFYLCWGNNESLLIGQFVDDVIEDYQYKEEERWKQRKYKFLYQRASTDSYQGKSKWWTPNNSSTCIQIPPHEFGLANDLLFRKYFEAELYLDTTTELDPLEKGPASRYPITISEKISAELEAEMIAKELGGIIDNLGDNKGQMLGIFGSWGRGKTFLYERLKAYIERNKESKYHYKHFVFNAWKYQETEAVWAHLYGSLLDEYIGDVGFWGKQSKLFGLNIERKGWWPFVKVIAALLISIGALGLSTWEFFGEGTKGIGDGLFGVLSAVIGIGGLKSMNSIYKKHYKPVKQMLSDYTSINDYSKVLGLQAEIQKELIVLMNYWLTPLWKEQRLLLFVDDIDRCNEKKIVQVIDALRVMLDDDELIKKIIVLVAVDEVLLERAINHKYKEFKLEDDSPKVVVKEYMDKLFIGGVKLPRLDEFEQGVILEAYAINNGILEGEVRQEGKEGEVDEESETLDGKETTVEFDFSAIPKERRVVPSEFFLLEKELELLKNHSGLLSKNVTPRQLRIYMYRYLLSKNIASDYLNAQGKESQLSDDYCAFLAHAIAQRSNHENGTLEYTGDLFLENIDNESLRDFTPKLIEIVVPY